MNYVELKDKYDYAIRAIAYWRERLRKEKSRKKIGLYEKQLIYWNIESAKLEREIFGNRL